MICLMIAGVLNVLLNLFFVIGLHRNADGVAIATVISNAFSAIIMYVLLRRSKQVIRVDREAFHIDPHVFRVIIRIGLPAGLQSMVFSFSNIIIQSAINSLGADVMAGSSAAFYLEIFAFFILNAFSQACTTFVGQNYGAGNYARCRRAIRWCLWMNVGFTMALAIAIILFVDPLLRIFNPDPDVIAMGHIRVVALLSFEFFNCINETLSAAMRGLGYSLVPALTSLIGICGVRILWVYFVFPMRHTFPTLLICYPLSWCVTMFVMLAAYLAVSRKVLGQ